MPEDFHIMRELPRQERRNIWGYKQNWIRGLPGLDGERHDIPIYEYVSPVPGPQLLVSAGMHPDPEAPAINAVTWAALELTRYPLLRGRVTIIPQSNIWATLAGTHNIPQTDSDWNRSFPGNPRGNMAERAAHFYYSSIVKRFDDNAKLLNKSRDKIPPGIWVEIHNEDISDAYLRRDWKLKMGPKDEILGVEEEGPDEFADATGITVVKEYPLSIYSKRGLHRSVTGAATNDIKFPGKAYTIELGEGRTDYDSLAVGVRTILRMAAKLGMVKVSDDILKPESSRIAVSADDLVLVPINILFEKSNGEKERQIELDLPGYPTFTVKPNQPVGKNEVLGFWSNPSLITQRGSSPVAFVAPCDGWVISLPRKATYHPGNDLVTMAVKPEQLKLLDELDIWDSA